MDGENFVGNFGNYIGDSISSEAIDIGVNFKQKVSGIRNKKVIVLKARESKVARIFVVIETRMGVVTIGSEDYRVILVNTIDTSKVENLNKRKHA